MIREPAGTKRCQRGPARGAWHDGGDDHDRQRRSRVRPRLPPPGRRRTRPVWFMRQAGRSLPEYREIRAGIADAGVLPPARPGLRDHPAAGTPARRRRGDPVQRHRGAGRGGRGRPRHRARHRAGGRRADPHSRRRRSACGRWHPTDVSYVDEAVRLLVEELGATPLIGFAGAPFTLASYLVEGGPSRNHAKTKAMMYGAPELWHALCARLAARSRSPSCGCRSAAGVSAVQLFDSWAGALSEADYRRVRPAALGDGAARARRRRASRASTSGWARPSCSARWARRAPTWSASTGVPRWTSRPRRIGPDKAVQGNLDPRVLFAPWEVVEREVRRVLDEGRAAPGHVFNLGHGVLPETDPDVLTRVVALVHEVSAGTVSPRVAVVGGGIAGLAAAVRLRTAPAGARSPSTSSRRCWAASCAPASWPAPPVELGAESFLVRDPAGGDSAAVALARRLGLGDDLVTRRRRGGARRRRPAACRCPAARSSACPATSTRCRRSRSRTPDADADEGRPLLAPGRRRRGGRRWSVAGSATRSSTGWSTRCSAACTPDAPTACRWPPRCRRWPRRPAPSTTLTGAVRAAQAAVAARARRRRSSPPSAAG